MRADMSHFHIEATVGIEPTMTVFQTLALPLGDVAMPFMVSKNIAINQCCVQMQGRKRVLGSVEGQPNECCIQMQGRLT